MVDYTSQTTADFETYYLAGMGLIFLWEGQGDVRAHYNRNAAILRHLGNGAVNSVGNNAPSGSEVEGDAYVIGTSPTGVFAGHARNIALYVADPFDGDVVGWLFLAPREGMHVWNEVLEQRHYFDGTDWQVGPT